MSILR
ncbi:hypothetical protein E2C01_061206 [Portunus trituberculatus]